MTDGRPGTGLLPAGEKVSLLATSAGASHGLVARALMKTAGGSATMFSMAAGEGLREHRTPYEALLLVLDGQVRLQVGEAEHVATAGDTVRLEPHVPHAVLADAPSRMLLVLLKP